MQGAWAKGKPRIVRDEPAVSSAPQGPPNSQRRQNGHKAPKGQKGVQSRQKREAAPQRPQQRPRETPLPPQQQQGQPAVQPPLAPAPAPVVVSCWGALFRLTWRGDFYVIDLDKSLHPERNACGAGEMFGRISRLYGIRHDQP